MLLDGTLWERTFAECERGSTSVDDAESFVAEPFRFTLAGKARSSIARLSNIDLCI
jgi:hypothetical protein